MNKVLKYSLGVSVATCSFLGIVFAANTITNLSVTVNPGDTIDASWFNEVNTTLIQHKDILSGTKMDGKICSFASGKISCINDPATSNFGTLQEGKWCTVKSGKIECTENTPSGGWATSSGVIESFFSQQQEFSVGENSQKNLGDFSICTLTRTSTAEAAKHDNGWQYRGSCGLSKTAGGWVLKSEWKWRCEATCFGPSASYTPPSLPPSCEFQGPNRCCDGLPEFSKELCLNEDPF